MEDAQPLHEHLGQAPGLTAEEEDGEDERLVRLALGARRDLVRREQALAQRAEGLARVREPRLDRAHVGAVARDDVAKVLEEEDDGHREPAWQLHVREVGAVVRGGVGTHTHQKQSPK